MFDKIFPKNIWRAIGRRFSGDLIGGQSVFTSKTTSKLSINGKTFEGSTIVVDNNRISVDGVEQNFETGAILEVRILEGEISSLHTAGDVTCGNVRGNVNTAGDVTCGDVGGSVNTAGDVNCKKVGGNINTVGDVNVST